jgi:hypothetical protein
MRGVLSPSPLRVCDAGLEVLRCISDSYQVSQFGASVLPLLLSDRRATPGSFCGQAHSAFEIYRELTVKIGMGFRDSAPGDP